MEGIIIMAGLEAIKVGDLIFDIAMELEAKVTKVKNGRFVCVGVGDDHLESYPHSFYDFDEAKKWSRINNHV